MPETAYDRPLRHGERLEHHYGPNVHVLADPWSLALVARISRPETKAPTFHHLLQAGYRRLIEAAAEQLALTDIDVATRMAASEPRARFRGRVVDPSQRVVIVDIARAGMLPAHWCQAELLHVLEPDGVRVDHLYMQRMADPVTGAVVGVHFDGSKIGGDIDGATVIFPDPMGATGRSLVRAVEHYAAHAAGKPRRLVACHLIATPEYLAHVTGRFPELVVYTLRVDRGLSGDDVLATPLGSRWSEERGLDPHDYIVPGAGGLGELINNTQA